MIFELLGEVISSVCDWIGDLLEGGGELLAGGAELAAVLGTAVVALGAAATAMGAVIALAELSVHAIRKWLNSKNIAGQIENILNNNPNTLKDLLPGEILRGANKVSISQMKKVVRKVEKTPDGSQTVATIHIIHPRGVYYETAIAGNSVKDVREGMVI